jgi:RsiW-degrading membrane proteinase PrsW (M82 family)
MDFLTSLLFAFAGGILPALIWLYFWLKEDSAHPEHNKLIILTFVMGMISVPFALVFQLITNHFLLANQNIEYVFISNFVLGISTIVIWAFAEELVKYFGAYFGGLCHKDNDEPIDPIIYMITAALGFSALENVMFLFGPIFQGNTTVALMTGNMRFIGATLLHISASAIIGIFMSYSYYNSKKIKFNFLVSGFILSVALHSIFNSFIINSGTFTLVGFSLVWFSIIIIILIFENIKHKIIPKNFNSKV